MLNRLQSKKELIKKTLLKFLTDQAKNFKEQSLSQEAFGILKNFVASGKIVRGSLFLVACQTIDPQTYEKNQEDLLKIAVALELTHSSLLIHDDIIDQDETRRGQDSVWQQYTKFAKKNNYKQPRNYGESLAICLGNILHYLANLAINETKVLPQSTIQQIKKTIDREIIQTNFAEMLDSKITLQNSLPTEKQVLEMYLYKTARYTFSLPLQLAACVCHLTTAEIDRLVKIGENLGLIFQIKDDEISLFSSELDSGKSFASDIKEGKKTLFYLYLFKNARPQEKEFLLQKFGKREIDLTTIQQIQALFRQYSSKEIAKLMQNLQKNAQKQIVAIKIKSWQELLCELLTFNLERKS
jgi:geranylgeranyl diphosphate synthase type I